MKKTNKPLNRKEEIVVQELDGEVLVYDLKNNKAFCLNETSALVWQMCDGKKTVGEIAQSLSKKLKQPADEDLVWLALDQLKSENLIANGEELVSKFEGLNRRDVIKKVGLATMIALPVVAGMVAPKAIHAASVCNGACTCTNNPGQGNACTFTVTANCRAGCTCTKSNNGAGNNNGTCGF